MSVFKFLYGKFEFLKFVSKIFVKQNKKCLVYKIFTILATFNDKSAFEVPMKKYLNYCEVIVSNDILLGEH